MVSLRHACVILSKGEGKGKAGLNVDELLDKLVAAAGTEFTTFYYYMILRVNSIGHEGEGMKEIIEDARIEDRNHFEALVPRSCRT